MTQTHILQLQHTFSACKISASGLLFPLHVPRPTLSCIHSLQNLEGVLTTQLFTVSSQQTFTSVVNQAILLQPVLSKVYSDQVFLHAYLMLNKPLNSTEACSLHYKELS